MPLGKNDIEDYEYSGSPKKTHLINIVIALLLGILMFWFSNNLYWQFIAFENGEGITIQHFLFATYQLVGKWPIVLFFTMMGLGFMYAAFTHYKKYQDVKSQDF